MKCYRIFGLIAGFVFTLTITNCHEKMSQITYVSNPSLKTISVPFSFKGTPINEKGEFINLDPMRRLTFLNVLKWFVSPNPQRKEKKQDHWRPKVVAGDDFTKGTDDCLVWLGHSSFYIRINGVVMITDPILFDMFTLKRQVGYCIKPENLGKIDYILLSHNHRDHVHPKSISFIAQKNPSLEILCGLGMERSLKKWAPGHKVQCAGWYQQFNVKGLNVYFLPVQHWAKRGLFDTNKTLWGAFVLQTDALSVYFAGDTGNGSHFERSADIFGGFDYCLMPIGAYKPEWLMSPQHISPETSVDAFNRLKGKVFVPMHYGTFDLSDEPMGEPFRKIERAGEGAINGTLKVLSIGEKLPLTRSLP